MAYNAIIMLLLKISSVDGKLAGGERKSSHEVTFFISSVFTKSHFQARKFYT